MVHLAYVYSGLLFLRHLLSHGFMALITSTRTWTECLAISSLSWKTRGVSLAFFGRYIIPYFLNKKVSSTAPQSCAPAPSRIFLLTGIRRRTITTCSQFTASGSESLWLARVFCSCRFTQSTVWSLLLELLPRYCYHLSSSFIFSSAGNFWQLPCFRADILTRLAGRSVHPQQDQAPTLRLTTKKKNPWHFCQLRSHKQKSYICTRFKMLRNIGRICKSV